MKKYTSRAIKWLAILAVVSVATFIAGIVCILANLTNVEIVLTMSGGLMSVLFLTCFFAAKSRCLIINDEKLILPSGADKNGKTSFQKTVINIDEICSIKSELYKGDGIISKDTFFYTLKLKDGTVIRFTLYDYGKDAEKEILESIKTHLANSNL